MNNRDLATFKEDLGVGESLAARIPASVDRGRGVGGAHAGRRRPARCRRVRRGARRRGARARRRPRRLGARPRGRAGESEVVMDTRFVLAQDKIPTAWYNALPGSPRADAAAAAPGHEGAGRPRRPRAALPDGAHRAGDDRRAHRRHPRARCSTSCGCGGRRRSCAPRRLEEALGTPARIYYKDESVSPAGFAQAEHRGRAGVLQQAVGHAAAHDRDRRRASGARRSRSRARSSTSSARSTWCARRTSRSRTAGC